MGNHDNQAHRYTAQGQSSTARLAARAAHRANDKAPTAIVIGGGPSGLIAARRLAAAGLRVTLLEQRPHLGGAVGAHEVGGLLLDSGAESFATRSPIVRELVEELGLGDQIVTPNSYGSWLYLPQGACRTPSTGIMGIPGNVSDKSLIPVIGKSGLRRAQLDRLLPASVGEKAKTLGELVRLRMGQKVLDNLVAPVVSGVYSTHPDKLDVDATIPGLRAALRKHGSLSAAAAAFRSAAPAGSQVAGIVGGMNQLSERLVEELYEAGVRIVTNFDVIAVDRDESTGQWFIIQRHTTDGENTPLYADYLVLATDGPTVARLIGPHVSTALPAVEPGPEVALVTLVVDAPDLNKHPRGTGLLVSEQATAVRAKALTHATAKWQWVADEAGPDRHVVRLSYGRGGEDSRFSEVALADEQLITLALRDATRMTDVPLTRNNLVDADVVRWRGVLPASTPGHRKRVQEFRERASELGTLSTVGSWAAGSGLVATVRDTYEQMDRLITHAAQNWKGVKAPEPKQDAAGTPGAPGTKPKGA